MVRMFGITAAVALSLAAVACHKQKLHGPTTGDDIPVTVNAADYSNSF